MPTKKSTAADFSSSSSPPPPSSSSSTKSPSKILQSSLSLASYGVLVQLTWRLSTFCLNALLIRYVSSEIIGIANVRLTLLYSTILFLSREPFRRACLGERALVKQKNFINLLWLVIPVGLGFACILVPIWCFALTQPNVAGYQTAVLFYTLAAIVELFSEPFWILTQIRLCVRLRVFVEGASVFLRCICLFLLINFFSSSSTTTTTTNSLFIFGFCQFIQGFIPLLFYLLFCLHDIHKQQYKQDDWPLHEFIDYLPQWKFGIDSKMAILIASFFKQSFVKQLLTEGERYIMSVLHLLDFSQQGIYDVVNNLGSLFARFVFLPLEDSAYLLFTQSLTRGKSYQQQDSSQVEQAHGFLRHSLMFVSLLGICICAFGQSYAGLALYIYGGNTLVDGAILLRWFTLYLILLAWNGLTESFFFALMSQARLNAHNWTLLCFSMIFLLASLVLVPLFGAVGFILSNCLNMTLRIVISCRFIYKFFNESSLPSPLWSLLPNYWILLTLAASSALCLYSQSNILIDYQLKSMAIHVLIGAFAFLFTLIVIFFKEKHFVTFFRQAFAKKR